MWGKSKTFCAFHQEACSPPAPPPHSTSRGNYDLKKNRGNPWSQCEFFQGCFFVEKTKFNQTNNASALFFVGSQAVHQSLRSRFDGNSSDACRHFRLSSATAFSISSKSQNMLCSFVWTYDKAGKKSFLPLSSFITWLDDTCTQTLWQLETGLYACVYLCIFRGDFFLSSLHCPPFFPSLLIFKFDCFACSVSFCYLVSVVLNFVSTFYIQLEPVLSIIFRWIIILIILPCKVQSHMMMTLHKNH